jgi:peptidoglycan/LPS O-acetylase OafA/YrhL
MNIIEAFIPIVALLAVAAVLISFFYLSHKNKKVIQDTIRHSIEQGNPLTPELLEKLATSHSPRVKDLRRGVVLASLGVAFMLAGLLVNDPDGTVGMMVAGMFPLMMGLGFLVVWKLNRYHD